MKLFIYFHLNLAYSSIEEEERLSVIERCYWPLLRLIEKYKIPIGLEASAYTLGEINRLDPAFIKKLKILIKSNDCDFIGSGFAQIIGPLVPWEINDFNLKIANKIYYKLLGIKPKIALINEQTISSGILDAYLKNGYKSILMDWDNIVQSNKRRFSPYTIRNRTSSSRHHFCIIIDRIGRCPVRSLIKLRSVIE